MMLPETIMSNDTIKENWNIIPEATFRKRMKEVFNNVAESLTNTLGPYGSTTIIEQFGEAHITKDGWQVLKNIRFDDNMSNNILLYLVRISQQVVVKVGDGSTSSIVATNEILKEIGKHGEVLNTMRPKEFMDLLSKIVEIITALIYSNSTKIDSEGDFEEIYRLAYISTNSNPEISKMVQEIYKATGNPSVEYTMSKNSKTYYEILNGYRLDYVSYLDPIFATSDDRTCHIENPYILTFNHTLEIGHDIDVINYVSLKAATEGRRLVIIAPNINKRVRDHVIKQTHDEIRSRGTTTAVWCGISMVNANHHILYSDFAMMSGATMMSDQFYDSYDMDNLSSWIDEMIGEVDEITISTDRIVINGLTKRNDMIYNKVLNDATAVYKQYEDEARAKSFVDSKLNDAKSRIYKLKGNMGTIFVGGYTSLEQQANFDLVEDAVKACESAFINGYNIGGNLIVVNYINKILTSDQEMSKEERTLYIVLRNAFRNVFKSVIMNKYREIGLDGSPIQRPEHVTDEWIDDIIDDCVTDDELRCYDLVSEEYSQDIINSCLTDIEILKAATNMVGLLVSSNQYITVL